MSLAPFPGRFNDLVDGDDLGFEAEDSAGPRGHRDEGGRIAGSPGTDGVRDLRAGHALDRLDDFAHGSAAAGPQIDRGEPGLDPVEGIESQDMGAGQVVHVDVVPQAGAVGRFVVIAKDSQGSPSTRGRVEGQRDQVLLVSVVFAERTVAPRSGRVEVTEGDRSYLADSSVGLQHLFEADPKAPAIFVNARGRGYLFKRP